MNNQLNLTPEQQQLMIRANAMQLAGHNHLAQALVQLLKNQLHDRR